MWLKIRDISVSDRLRSRCRPDDGVVQTNSAVAITRSLLDLPPSARSGVNAGLHTDTSERISTATQIKDHFQFAEECELADGRRPYPAGR